jgi:phytoene dehydrogenase-like protein
LTGGNIFHGAMSKLWYQRFPYRTLVEGLWMCGSGTHPGGGVSCAPGHNCWQELQDHLQK